MVAIYTYGKNNPMKTLKLKSLVPALLVCVALFITNSLQAQSTNATSKKGQTDEKDKSAHKSAHPFHGKLAAVDQAAKTITIGKSVYQITSETKITKSGKPAVLADGVIGEEASGYAKPLDGGKMYAASLNFGPKPEGKTAAKKKP
jgi:hypothetical protein